MNPRRRAWRFSTRFLTLLACPLLGVATSQAIVETFDNGSDDGDWHLSSNPNELLVIEPDGGNPGPYLHGTVDAAVPTWYVPIGTATHFLGNYARQQVREMTCDINIFAGLAVPDRAVTLDIETTFGTGDFSKGVDAYFVGKDISTFPIGWYTYRFPLDAASATIPPGWVVTKGNGKPGTDADWQALMRDVETLGVELGQPGYFYPDWIFDLGLDNVRLRRSVVNGG